MTRYYGDEVGGSLPADLEKTNAASAATAASTSKDSYVVKINLPLIKAKQYKFWFKYKHEDPDTKEIKLSDSSPIWIESFTIPNLTKAVQNLTLTPGLKSYGVKFTLDPTSVQEDVVIFESLTGAFAGEEYIVYVGTSTNVTIQVSSYAQRWVRVRSRDKWDDLNITNASAGPVAILNAEVDTTRIPTAPLNSTVSGAIDPDDLSGFSVKITASWTANTDTDTSGYVIRWSSQDPSIVASPVWEYGQVDGRTTTTFSITGLTPNTKYYWQVTSKSPFNTISWASPQSGSVGPIVDPNAPADVWSQLKSIISIGGKTADLFKIGTGIAQSINTSTTITPAQTSGTYSGIILNRSTTNFGHNYWLNTGQFRVGSASAFLYWDGSDVYTTGKINATGGTFTGNLQVTTGSIFAGSLTGARVVLQPSGLFAHDATGAQSVVIQSADGLIDARKGYIGGWTINATSQSVGYIQSSNTKIESSGNITLGDTTGTLTSIVKLSASDPTYRLWVGSQDAQTAANNHFAVTKEGKLYASGAQISGQLVISSGTTYDSIVLASQTATAASNTATAASNTATAASNTATAASNAASTAQSRADSAYNKAVAAGDDATLAATKAQQAKDAADLKMAAGDINTVLAYNTTIINGDRITTGTIDVARLNITGGNTTNGFAIDGNGIRGYSGGSQNLTISSGGAISLKGTVYASSGQVGGFSLSNGDLSADFNVGPRIYFGNKINIGWESGYPFNSSNVFNFIAGSNSGSDGAQFYVNTNSNVFRFAADSASRAYAAEVRNTLRATNLRYITGLINDSSSRRFKENITYLPESYYNKILNVRPAFYTYINDHPETDSALWGTSAMGPIAEELEEAGLGFFVERNLNGQPTALRNEHKLTYLLIPLVKDMKEKIDLLESRIVELEKTNV